MRLKKQRIPWPIKKEHSDHMRMRKAQNLSRCVNNKAENWMLAKLQSGTRLKWTRQALWGYRVFDFWNHLYGINVEVDGETHNPRRDAHYDREHLRRSAIITIRVPNFDEVAAAEAIAKICAMTETWEDRRKRLGLHKSTRGQSGQQRLAELIDKEP